MAPLLAPFQYTRLEIKTWTHSYSERGHRWRNRTLNSTVSQECENEFEYGFGDDMLWACERGRALGVNSRDLSRQIRHVPDNLLTSENES